MKFKKIVENEDIVGKHNNVPDNKFSKDQLKKGIKIEMEHTDNKDIAKNIAKDHLSEFENYYDALIKMEKELKGE